MVAEALAPELGPPPGAVVLRSDVVRKVLHGATATSRLPPEAYTAAATERVYAALRDQAAEALRAGRSAIVDAAFYPTDDLELSIGASIIGDQEFARAGLEYQFADSMTVSFGGKIGEDDYFNVTGGLSFYFGGGEKSLIRRHREDDPDNRILDFVGFKEAKNKSKANNTGTGTNTQPPPTTSPPFTGTLAQCS